MKLKCGCEIGLLDCNELQTIKQNEKVAYILAQQTGKWNVHDALRRKRWQHLTANGAVNCFDCGANEGHEEGCQIAFADNL